MYDLRTIRVLNEKECVRTNEKDQGHTIFGDLKGKVSNLKRKVAKAPHTCHTGGIKAGIGAH